jgi:hypothetical protein
MIFQVTIEVLPNDVNCVLNKIPKHCYDLSTFDTTHHELGNIKAVRYKTEITNMNYLLSGLKRRLRGITCPRYSVREIKEANHAVRNEQ